MPERAWGLGRDRVPDEENRDRQRRREEQPFSIGLLHRIESAAVEWMAASGEHPEPRAAQGAVAFDRVGGVFRTGGTYRQAGRMGDHAFVRAEDGEERLFPRA
jgi:hypothetical protein